MTKYGILLDTSNVKSNRQSPIGNEELKEHGEINDQSTAEARIICKETSDLGKTRYMKRMQIETMNRKIFSEF